MFRVVKTVVLGNGGFVPCQKKQGILTKTGENDEFAFYIHTHTRKYKGSGPQNPESDENDENGGCHSGKTMVYRMQGFHSENPRAHKNKIGTPPPKKTQNTRPPLERGILLTWLFPAERTHFPGAYKIGAAISGPRIADKKLYGHGDFSDSQPRYVLVLRKTIKRQGQFLA